MPSSTMWCIAPSLMSVAKVVISLSLLRKIAMLSSQPSRRRIASACSTSEVQSNAFVAKQRHPIAGVFKRGVCRRHG